MQDNQIPTDLIARLEAAAEGDRGLDRAIAEAISLDPKLFPGGGQYVSYDHADGPLPHYTTSQDSALTLMPEKIWLMIEWVGMSREWPVIRFGPPHGYSQAKTAALAICAAALKLRAEKEG